MPLNTVYSDLLVAFVVVVVAAVSLADGIHNGPELAVPQMMHHELLCYNVAFASYTCAPYPTLIWRIEA